MDKIDKLRREKGLTVEQLCSEVEICRKSYYNYINHQRQMTTDIIIRLSRLFGVSSDFLLGIKNYTHITVVDNEGALLADIGQEEIIEHKDIKVILT